MNMIEDLKNEITELEKNLEEQMRPRMKSNPLFFLLLLFPPIYLWNLIAKIITRIKTMPLRREINRKKQHYRKLSLEVVRKQKVIEPIETTVQPTKIRHITCKYCGYATPEDMVKCQHCGAAI